MFMSYEECLEIKDIKFLYELRHLCNVHNVEIVSKGLGVPLKKIIILYESEIHGSTPVKQFFGMKEAKFMKKVEEYEMEEIEHEEHMMRIHHKNQMLVTDLKDKRTNFAKIGTNKAKRRLNKLALNNPIAKAVRLALEIEDKSICAKDARGIYQERIYKQKSKLILELCELFKENNWVYGVQKSDIPLITHVIYFEIPDCEQISWHFTPENKGKDFPIYEKQWDRKPSSTLRKLEKVSINLLNCNLQKC